MPTPTEEYARLTGEIAAANAARNSADAAAKAGILALVAQRDALDGALRAQRKFDKMTKPERAAMAQLLGLDGIQSEETLGDLGR